MKPMTVAILAGSLLLGALPAFAASPAAPSPSATRESFIESAATAYLNNADWQYNDWSQKMADLTMGVMEKKVAMSVDARANVDKAWDNLKLRWAGLRTANNRDWDNARASWETASNEMQAAWQRL
jgi:hypothetical protein